MGTKKHAIKFEWNAGAQARYFEDSNEVVDVFAHCVAQERGGDVSVSTIGVEAPRSSA